ncbi:MAG TPA: hypothetical protein P5295_03455 [Spirochaetota bacterium]|nr:hypothetical protein [Spirochaetota bacterium]
MKEVVIDNIKPFIKKSWPVVIFVGVCVYLLYNQAIAVLEFLKINWASLRFPYPLDYGEGQLLDKVMLLSRFKSIYTSTPHTCGPPYAIANYPPVYPLIQVPFAWLFGPAMWYGRAISILSILASSVFIGLTIHSLTGKRLAGVIGGITLLCFPYIAGFSMFARVDSLALFLSCAAMYTAVQWGGSRYGIIATGLLLLGSIYTKQSYGFAMPLTIFIWLYYERSPRRALELAALVGIPGLLLFVLINFTTEGSFYFNTITATRGHFNAAKMIKSFEGMLIIYPLLVGMAVLYCLLGLLQVFRTKSWRLVAPFIICSAVVSILIGNEGSSWNYLYEHAAAFSLLAGCLFGLAGNRRLLSGIAALLIATQIQTMIPWTQKYFFSPTKYRLEHEEDISRINALVHQAEGYVLADQYAGLIPLDNRPLYLMPWEFKNVVESKIWSEQPFIDALARHEFGLIIMVETSKKDYNVSFWQPSVIEAIKEHYYPVDIIADCVIFKPRVGKQKNLTDQLAGSSVY